MHNANTSVRDTAQPVAKAAAVTAVIGVLAFLAAVNRRWMSDDGLIVLRTVRNLIAGNGPVFNAGERVEANTSTLWQYLILAGHYLTGGADLSAIATWLAIFLSTAAMAIGAWATASTFGRPENFRGGRHSMPRGIDVVLGAKKPWLLPAGALVYLALPPARDFFTSGLEWGLSIFWLAVLWWLLVRWARVAESSAPASAARGMDSTVLVLAFWAGISWLVRPELALYGGITGLVLFAAHRHWRNWLIILAVALPVPLAYQIFRMGYYGLVTPHTAVAKSASGSAWGSGFAYLGDFVGPYWLWLPLVILAGLAFGLVFGLAERRLRSQTTAVLIICGCALLHLVYVLRVGGDFMHGRMLLLPLFALLLPVFVLPLRSKAVAIGVGLIAIWAIVIVWRGHPVDWAMFSRKDITVVDEREYWTYATKREHGNPPKNAEDFRAMRLLRGYDNGLAGLERGDAMAFRYLENTDDPESVNWLSTARDATRQDPPTLYLINMGMSSMNAPLDVRVLDNIGLATPLAARQPRIEGGRIGHDKSLDPIWQVADSAAAIDDLPPWYDKDKVKAAREALGAPEFQELFASYRGPLTAERFLANLKFSLTTGRTLELSADPADYLPVAK